MELYSGRGAFPVGTEAVRGYPRFASVAAIVQASGTECAGTGVRLPYGFGTENGHPHGHLRGEDGYLALQLKQFGKIAFVRKRRARAVTGYGTVGADGSLFNSFKVRVVNGLKGIGGLFTKKKEYKDEESNLVKKNNKEKDARKDIKEMKI